MSFEQRFCQLVENVKELQQQLYCLGNKVNNTEIPTLQMQFIAGTTISGGSAVILWSDKKVYPFDINNPAHYGLYIGIAETAANTMGSIDIILQGYSKVIGTGWGAGVGYYIGANSFLTPIPPVIGMIKQVAIGINDNTILVSNQREVIAI